MTSKTDHPKPLARITKPMVRENGELREASWDEALTRALAAAADSKQSKPNSRHPSWARCADNR